jgi:putative nucleotidyltransferase with HDIG domain
VVILPAALLAGAVVAALLAAGIGDWSPAVLAVLFVFIAGSDRLEIARPHGLAMSGGFLGLVVAMAILGPAQAALLGVLATALHTVVMRPRREVWGMNFAAFALFPLSGGLAIHGLSSVSGVTTGDAEFVLVLLPGFAVANLVNFLVVVLLLKLLQGDSVRERFRREFVPLIPSELAMVLLASVIVYAYEHVGAIALGTLTALFFLYLWLLRELLLSQDRAEELDTRTRQLASLQVGVLTAMLKTLALRDHMTARHCAAVARYARALAREAGCSEVEVDLVHTAGLLHDIGKFIFPDHILLASSKLSDDDWEVVKRHPYQGAKVVRQVEGYGPVADIIWAHHERIDGRGYPRGLADEEIPLGSRMISIADTYDVMTSRNSYRNPVTHEAAIEELRRVSGAQLDGRLVELFVGMLERDGVAFRHGDDADFEAELQFERRVREYAAPRVVEEEPQAA